MSVITKAELIYLLTLHSKLA